MEKNTINFDQFPTYKSLVDPKNSEVLESISKYIGTSLIKTFKERKDKSTDQKREMYNQLKGHLEFCKNLQVETLQVIQHIQEWKKFYQNHEELMKLTCSLCTLFSYEFSLEKLFSAYDIQWSEENINLWKWEHHLKYREAYHDWTPKREKWDIPEQIFSSDNFIRRMREEGKSVVESWYLEKIFPDFEVIMSPGEDLKTIREQYEAEFSENADFVTHLKEFAQMRENHPQSAFLTDWEVTFFYNPYIYPYTAIRAGLEWMAEQEVQKVIKEHHAIPENIPELLHKTHEAWYEFTIPIVSLPHKNHHTYNKEIDYIAANLQEQWKEKHRNNIIPAMLKEVDKKWGLSAYEYMQIPNPFIDQKREALAKKWLTIQDNFNLYKQVENAKRMNVVEKLRDRYEINDHFRYLAFGYTVWFHWMWINQKPTDSFSRERQCYSDFYVHYYQFGKQDQDRLKCMYRQQTWKYAVVKEWVRPK